MSPISQPPHGRAQPLHASGARMHVTARRLVQTASAMLLLALAACTARQPPYALQNITGIVPDLKFDLLDDSGRPVTAADYRGRIVLMYFGYTHCPDACPTTLSMLNGVLRNLGAAAADVAVLFVSVDPQRDTGPDLRRYLNYFNPRFVGLRSNGDAPLDALTRRYRIAYHRDTPDRYGNYAVEHSSAIFIFGRDGKARLLGSSDDPPQKFTQDLTRLLRPG